MDYETEQKLKATCAKQTKRPYDNVDCGPGEIRGISNQAMDAPGFPNLRERILSRLGHAGREASKLESLRELQHLLDKNPETARILELVELVGKD